MDGAFFDGREIIGSILHRTNGFVYRCRNDRDYSMLLMEGAVAELTGYPTSDFIEMPQRSYSGLTHPEDTDTVFAAVDSALERRENWSVDYRLVRPDGSTRWVHEVGGGVFDASGALQFLEGIVLDYEQRKREEALRGERNQQITEFCRNLVSETKPILSVLRELRILAINARIEAARAGQAGAGFAVVAGEVGRIANETTTRASTVSDLTEELQKLLRNAR
ncbi:MAG: PAS domain-containing protein [Rhodobacteraceae bacterium]|jgi:PAS domain S-box-containing protein|nr:PAS domain-containing protein [Paracoccaceae bacterium]MCZ8334842.1 PAS domain-containing protein [Paracoccaceae bacterium]